MITKRIKAAFAGRAFWLKLKKEYDIDNGVNNRVTKIYVASDTDSLERHIILIYTTNCCIVETRRETIKPRTLKGLGINVAA
jgi:hypothetical protein